MNWFMIAITFVLVVEVSIVLLIRAAMSAPIGLGRRWRPMLNIGAPLSQKM